MTYWNAMPIPESSSNPKLLMAQNPIFTSIRWVKTCWEHASMTDFDKVCHGHYGGYWKKVSNKRQHWKPEVTEDTGAKQGWEYIKYSKIM